MEFWWIFPLYVFRGFVERLGLFRISGLPRLGQDVDFSEN